MLAKDIMTKDVTTVRSNMTARELAKILPNTTLPARRWSTKRAGSPALFRTAIF